jgi:hypothetical protein
MSFREAVNARRQSGFTHTRSSEPRDAAYASRRSRFGATRSALAALHFVPEAISTSAAVGMKPDCVLSMRPAVARGTTLYPPEPISADLGRRTRLFKRVPDRPDPLP